MSSNSNVYTRALSTPLHSKCLPTSWQVVKCERIHSSSLVLVRAAGPREAEEVGGVQPFKSFYKADLVHHGVCISMIRKGKKIWLKCEGAYIRISAIRVRTCIHGRFKYLGLTRESAPDNFIAKTRVSQITVSHCRILGRTGGLRTKSLFRETCLIHFEKNGRRKGRTPWVFPLRLNKKRKKYDKKKHVHG